VKNYGNAHANTYGILLKREQFAKNVKRDGKTLLVQNAINGVNTYYGIATWINY
jgi:hypothetical protein